MRPAPPPCARRRRSASPRPRPGAACRSGRRPCRPRSSGRRSCPCGAVGVEGEQRRGLGAEQPAGLLGDRREHLLGRRLAGHERGHAAQRGLLGGEPRELLEAVAQLGLQRPQLAGRRLALGDVEAARDARSGPRRRRRASGPVGPRDQRAGRRPWSASGPGAGSARGASTTPRAVRRTGRRPRAGTTRPTTLRPTTSSAVKPVASSQARLKRTMRPSRSRTQISVCAVSRRAAPKSRSGERVGDVRGGPRGVARRCHRSRCPTVPAIPAAVKCGRASLSLARCRPVMDHRCTSLPQDSCQRPGWR